MTTERIIQKKVLNYLRTIDILAVKTDSTSTRGWPDLTVILPTGEVHFVEVKTTSGRLSEHQKRIHQELTDKGANIHVIRSLEAAQALFPPDR